jgi:hypothetical protein
VEKHGSIVYTHNMFNNFQAEVVYARDHCSVVGITQAEIANFVVINDGSKKEIWWFAGAH